MVLFALEYGDQSLIAAVFVLNILALFLFTALMMMDPGDNKSLTSRVERLFRIIFDPHPDHHDSGCFDLGFCEGQSFKNKDAVVNPFRDRLDHHESRTMRMGLHYPEQDTEWIQRSKQIGHENDRLRIRMDAKGRVVKVTDDVAAFHNTTKKRLMRFTKDDIHERLHLDNPIWFQQALKSYQSHATGETRMNGKQVKIFWLFKAIYDHDERLSGIEGYGRRITDFIDAPDTKTDNSLDTITGLKNAQALYEGLSSQTLPEKAVAFFLDVDGFSKINDYYGYIFGNKVLKRIADSLNTLENDHVMIGRVSADQFALICMENDTQTCKETTDAMGAFTQMPLTIGDVDLLLNIKIGYAKYPEHASTLEELIAKANIALKHKANHSPYAFVSYEHSIGDALKRQVHIAQRLKKAIHEDSLDIHFQKILDVRTESVSLVEALVRWTDAVYGRINPVDVFEVAKAAGMTIMLEEVLVEKALRLFKKLREDPDFEDTNLALNLAPESLMDENFHNYLERLMQKQGLDYSDITIEISERIFMNDLESCLERIHTYKAKGFRIAIDDFGKDFSSLAILERIDFDVIKIDAMFVRNINIKKNQEIFRMVRRITENTRQSLIVEGVETKDQKHILEALGCFHQQGFLHHYPRPLK